MRLHLAAKRVTRLVVFWLSLAGIAAAHAQTQPVENAGPLLAAASYDGYGIQQPQGLDAVNYLYSAQGTWRHFHNLIDPQNTAPGQVPEYGYYCGWTGAVSNQFPIGTWGSSACPPISSSPYKPLPDLVALANGKTDTSVPSANDDTLYQLTYQQAGTKTGVSGYAFEEHAGRGAGGVLECGGPKCDFSQFWFDDNWLARYMSEAYGAPAPDGLYAPPGFNRWAIIGGGTADWTPYPSPGNYIDQLCLNGLYDFDTGNDSLAYTLLASALSLAGETYSTANQQYEYPDVYAAYYIGLMAILNDTLLESGEFGGAELDDLVQQSVSLHSKILADQQHSSSGPIGWTTGNGRSSIKAGLINTETTTVMVLALSTAAKYTFEPGLAPARSDCTTCLQRPYHVLSAVVGLTAADEYMTYGPYIHMPLGNYKIEFYLRTPLAQTGNIANLDVHDNNSGAILGSSLVSGDAMAAGDQWTLVAIPISVTNPHNRMEFRVYWYGAMNLDIRAIRVH